MTRVASFTIKTIHPRVGRYLKRQEKRVQDKFWNTLEHICEKSLPVDDPAHIAHLKGPFHCSYRYVLLKGKRGLRIKYDVDIETRKITVYDFGPRKEAYRP